ncbi:hypothetical protein AUJ65_04355 [Candidatus Micrarchaeota archaeon CG1_02_51_15]|nr:MAG: hypothetical protein AUJ65_04355 [Candidatus Micrarchaeota archaeon CG1_02_51_15]
MSEIFVLRQLSVNSLFWVGIAAVVFGLIIGEYSFLLLFAALMAVNYVMLSLVRRFAPELFAQLTEYHEPRKTVNADAMPGRNLGFRIYPLPYPKIMDEDLNDYAPEMIHLDIKTDGGLVFQGNFNRDALKQFRDALGQVLSLKNVLVQPVPAPKKKKAAK